jgi:hypothetical protein
MIAPTKAPTAVTTPVEANRPEKWKETRRKVRSNFDQWKYCIFSSAGETSWLSKESLTVHEFGGEREERKLETVPVNSKTGKQSKRILKSSEFRNINQTRTFD